MERIDDTEQRVKAANRQLYDAVADQYESLDGRRSAALEAWLRRNLETIRGRASGGVLLDLGTGSGFVSRCAEGLFTPRIGLDLSPRILAATHGSWDVGLAADLDELPLGDASVDVVACFAVLHHLHGLRKLVSETARVLRPGGVFYSDHDMDATFSRRFRLPLGLYRRFHNAQSRYRRACEEITPELYELSEYRGRGIDSGHLIRLLRESGFAVKARFHWFGLSWATDRLLGTRQHSPGWAPLVSVVAVKKADSSSEVLEGCMPLAVDS